MFPLCVAAETRRFVAQIHRPRRKEDGRHAPLEQFFMTAVIGFI